MFKQKQKKKLNPKCVQERGSQRHISISIKPQSMIYIHKLFRNYSLRFICFNEVMMFFVHSYHAEILFLLFFFFAVTHIAISKSVYFLLVVANVKCDQSSSCANWQNRSISSHMAPNISTLMLENHNKTKQLGLLLMYFFFKYQFDNFPHLLR